MKRSIVFLFLMLQAYVNCAGGTVNQFTLSNGLNVIHMEITGNPLVTLQLFTRAGTIDETPEQAGLAQFTISMMPQGTARYTNEQLAAAVEDIGGSISSDSEYDYGSMGISLLDSFFPNAMELLSEVAINPVFPEDEIEKERQNTLASLRARNDQIFYVANDLLNSSFYGTHPYAWPDSGKPATVSRFKRQDLLQWHKDHFFAGNMLLVIAGNVNLQTAKATAEKYFAALPAEKHETSRPRAVLPAAQKLKQPSKRFKQAYVMIGFPAPDLKSADFPVLKVVNALLGGRMTGRLFTELREKKSLGYEVNSFYPSRVDVSRFVIYLGLEKKNVEQAKTGIMAIVKDLKDTPVGAKELEETKNFIRGVYLLDHQTIGRRAWNAGFWEIVGRGYTYDAQYLNDLMTVTSADIQNAARKYFNDTYVQVEVVPE